MHHHIKIELRCRIGHRIIGHPKCQNPHGEGLIITAYVSSADLNSQGMVVDFGIIKRLFNEWVDKNLDHAFCYSSQDTVMKEFLEANNFKRFELSNSLKGVLAEDDLRNTNPTSENLSEIIYRQFADLLDELGQKLRLDRIDVQETFPDSIASYTP